MSLTPPLIHRHAAAVVAATQPGVCPSCGYNLPFHDMGCIADGKALIYACPEHAPIGPKPEPYDDGRPTCVVCGHFGGDVKPYRLSAEVVERGWRAENIQVVKKRHAARVAATPPQYESGRAYSHHEVAHPEEAGWPTDTDPENMGEVWGHHNRWTLKQIPIKHLADPEPPRSNPEDEASHHAQVQDIIRSGLQSAPPILAEPNPHRPGHWNQIDGNHRMHAHIQGGSTHIPALVPVHPRPPEGSPMKSRPPPPLGPPDHPYFHRQAATLPEGHVIEHHGPSPLDYSESTSRQPERLSLVKDDGTEGEKGDAFFGEYWTHQRRNPKTNRMYKAPKRVDTPKAKPGTRAFVDHSIHDYGDGPGGGKEIEVHYMKTRGDSRGQGHATTLLHHLLDRHPGASVNWGKVMSDEMNSVRQKVEGAHPDRKFRHKKYW